VQESSALEENKRIATEFYDAAINRKDFEAAAQYLGSEYTQHNPTAADGPEGLRGFIDFLKARYPEQRGEIKRVIAEAISWCCMCTRPAATGRRDAQSSTSSASMRARSWSTGTSSRTSLWSRRTRTACSETFRIHGGQIHAVEAFMKKCAYQKRRPCCVD
jgi:hypothetical protein